MSSHALFPTPTGVPQPYMVDMINDGYVNVVKMETADSDDKSSDFHITEDDIPSVYMGF